MDLFKSLIVTAMGFLVGLVLAGAGGLSAEAFFKSFQQNENNKRLEAYWAEAGLGYSDVEALISNLKCNSSAHYARACLNAIVQNKIEYSYDLLGLSSDKIAVNDPDTTSTELSEKEVLSAYENQKIRIDYDLTLREIFLQAETQKHSQIAGELINDFLSVYYDPHTYILPTRYFDEVSAKLDRSPYFVGLTYVREKGDIVIEKVSINSDAEHAGLQESDVIEAINGRSMKNLAYREISLILRNPKTKQFTFQVRRGSQRLDISFKRSMRVLSQAQFNLVGEKNDIALITVSKFSQGLCEEVKGMLSPARVSQLKGVILDLRDNPGGQLDEAACMTGLFLGPDKKAYYVEYASPNLSNEVVLTGDDKIYEGPLVVLINNRSASASESLAGALREYKRAVLVGNRTFGKGTFQEPEDWVQNPKISLFKTQGFYLLPSRNTTQIVGVMPDLQTELNERLHRRNQSREQTTFVNPLPAPISRYPELRDFEMDEKPFRYACVSLVKHHLASQFITQNISEKDDLFIAGELIKCHLDEKLKMAEIQKSTPIKY